MPLVIHEDANALKAKGKGARLHGSASSSIVCGKKLCSEPKNYPSISPPIESRSQSLPQESGQLTINEKNCPDYTSKFQIATMTNEISSKDYPRPSAPATIPLHQGYSDEKYVYYIITDSTYRELAQKISIEQCWPVQNAPSLSVVDEAVRPAVYIFSNGLEGNGILGYQSEVFAATPAHDDVYTGLVTHHMVRWNHVADSHTLISEKEIFHAKQLRLITITKSPNISNMPQIIWPGGQMPVKANKTISADTPYLGGQIIDINLKNMTATFIARQGWSPDGKPLYSIVVGATPKLPAAAFGVSYSSDLARIFNSSAVLDNFFFMNGIKGPGAMGYQTGIFQSGSTEPAYSPLWRINMVSWKKQNEAVILQTIDEINSFKNSNRITINPAKPMGLDHVINAPIIGPFR